MNSLEVQIGEILKTQQWTVATAESCTGGLIGDLITNISGSSGYFMGGIISYSNEAKMRLLNVREETLIAVGAVSEEVAHQMAQNARTIFNTTFALSVTGIAGPMGGTAEKPLGLTYIGLATPENVTVKRFVWTGNRTENKESSANAALDMLLQHLHERSPQ